MRELLNQIKNQLGWQGIVGVALFALAGFFMVFTLKPLELTSARMHSKLDAARSKAAIKTRTFSLDSRQKELELFFASLPAEQEVTDVLASIYSIAELSGVELKQAEYHLDDKNRPQLEYGMKFPVQGEYGKIRYLVSRVLAKHPAISLDKINFQRDKIDDPVLKAEIQLTLFLR
jgi:Tfp pilus assembly protein PilO